MRFPPGAAAHDDSWPLALELDDSAPAVYRSVITCRVRREVRRGAVAAATPVAPLACALAPRPPLDLVSAALALPRVRSRWRHSSVGSLPGIRVGDRREGELAIEVHLAIYELAIARHASVGSSALGGV